MADNISVTAGSGTTIAADDISGVLHQRVKIAWGVDGSAVDASATDPFPVTVSNASIPVTGTFWQATQPVSGTVSVSGSVAVTGTFYQATQPISAASLPLPTGAATSAKQPALGTAGTASSDVLTVQGIASMTALKVDGSAVTQPISGSLTNISGTISLPTGAATSANQSTLNTAIGSSSDAATANGVAGSIASYLRSIRDAATDTTTASIVDQTKVGGTAIASGNGTASAGCQRVTIASDNTAFSVNATTTPATTAYALIPAPSTYRLLSAAATTNGANIKSSAGAVKGIQGYNAKASAVYLKLYNKASSPTVGTDTPVKTIYLPATAAFAIDFGTGINFATGISIALTGSGADADTTALSAGDILALNVDYH